MIHLNVEIPVKYTDSVIRNKSIGYPLETKDLLIGIFKYLSLSDCVRISLVCKHWNRIVKNPSLEYAKLYSVFKMTRGQPQSSVILPKGKYEFHTANLQMAFISQCETSNLFIINKGSEIISIDLKDALTDKEKEHHILKQQNLRSVVVLPTDKKESMTFITATQNGTLVWWEICSKVIRCIDHLQFFKTEWLESQKPYNYRLFNAFASQNKIWVKWNNTRLLPNMGEVDLDLRVKSSESSIKNNPGSLKACNSSCLFGIFFKDKATYLKSVNSQLTSVVSLTHDEASCTPNERSRSIVGVNDKWVAIACFYQRGKKNQVTFFHIFDAGLNFIFKFKEKFDHLPYRFDRLFKKDFMYSDNDETPKWPSWLCDDFLVVWVGNELKIWHLPSKLYLTSINLEKILKPEELDDTNPAYQPILNVEIYRSELHLIIQDLAGNVRLLKYGIMGDSTAKEAKNLTPVKGILKRLWSKLSR